MRNGLFSVIIRSSRTPLGSTCPPAKGRRAGPVLAIRLAWLCPCSKGLSEDTRLYLSPLSREDLWTFFTFSFTEEDVENFDVTNLSQDMLRSIEADSFWCMSKLLDGIQVSRFCPCESPGFTELPVGLWVPYCSSALDTPHPTSPGTAPPLVVHSSLPLSLA